MRVNLESFTTGRELKGQGAPWTISSKASREILATSGRRLMDRWPLRVVQAACDERPDTIARKIIRNTQRAASANLQVHLGNGEVSATRPNSCVSLVIGKHTELGD